MQFSHFHIKSTRISIILSLILALLFAIFIHRYFRYTPAQSDGGTFEAVGQAMRNGDILYKDVWDNKAPGVFFLNDWAQRICPNPTDASALLRFLFIAIVNFSFLLFSSKSVLKLGITCLLLPLLWQFNSDWKYFESGHYTEFFGVVLVMLSAVILHHYQRQHSKWVYFLSGIFAVSSVLLKEPFIFLFIVVFLLALFYSKWKLNKILPFAFGASFPVILLSIYLIWNGAFGSFVTYFQFAFSYASPKDQSPFSDTILLWYENWISAAPILAFLTIPFLLSLFDLKRLKHTDIFPLFLIILLISAAIFPYLGSQLYNHYFIPMQFVVSLCILWGIHWVWVDLPEGLHASKTAEKMWYYGIVWLLWLLFVWNLCMPIKNGYEYFIKNTYSIATKPNTEKRFISKNIPPKSTLYIEHEAMGRYYLYHNGPYRHTKFPTPHIVYFGTEKANTQQELNREMIRKEFGQNPPDFILGRKNPGTSMVYCGLADFIIEEYPIKDSIVATEGEWLYLRERKR